MIAEARSILRTIKRSGDARISDDFFSAFDSRVWEKDGMWQVYVPAGKFDMGKLEEKASDHSPEHAVMLGEYWIDAYEVTNDLYRSCVEGGGCTPPDSINWMYKTFVFDQYPVVYVTWYQAQEYCAWAEKDLPTEAEWEKAARGNDGRKYLWGEDRPSSTFANFGNGIGTLVSSRTYAAGASPYGALNMSGNAREWISDWYNPTYYQRSPASDPTGSSQGKTKSLGGAGLMTP